MLASTDTLDASSVTSRDAELLTRFVTAFKRGIEGEIAALRTSSEASALTLAGGEDLGGLRYGFGLAEPTDKLAAIGDCRLRTAHHEVRATVERYENGYITVLAEQAIDLAAAPFTLVISPWFLYERMLQVLDELHVDRHSITLALRLFGKRPYRRASTALQCDHDALNASQRAAVQLCNDSDLAFIWGPPGTGKTVTLTHLLEELRGRNLRILLASTTNAAIDQILAKLAHTRWFAPAVEAGAFVRLGRSEHETFGAQLADIVDRAESKHRVAIDRLRARVTEVEQQLRRGELLLAGLAPAVRAQQSLFEAPATPLRAPALSSLFPPGLAAHVATMSLQSQVAASGCRIARLLRIQALARVRISRHLAEVRDLEQRVIDSARVVMCTLTNAYVSPLMQSQRFDVLIVEEAGMATLPTLFYAASLCREKAIMVGDPRQLPPIVSSREEIVQRAIGRNIFEVTVPDPTRSEVVAMLDLQYRMHPTIGTLVGRLFYEGRLMHGAAAAASEAIASRAPYPGVPLVVLDTGAFTTCQRSESGSSRVNPRAAEIAAHLALEAVDDGAESVAVITPYVAQARDIRRRVAGHAGAGAVECSTIHRFQGRECDVVIIDLVDAAPLRPGVLLADARSQAAARNLLNVSISRARGKLVIVADVGYFERCTPGGAVTSLLREVIADGVRIHLDRPMPA